MTDWLVITCPDCGADVIRAHFRKGPGYVDAEDVPRANGKVGLCDLGMREEPTAVRLDGYAGQCYNRHACPCREKLSEMSTIHRLYAEQGKEPEITVARNECDPDVGDNLTLYDEAGNEVHCTVKRYLVAVVPDWSTFRNPKIEREQESLL